MNHKIQNTSNILLKIHIVSHVLNHLRLHPLSSGLKLKVLKGWDYNFTSWPLCHQRLSHFPFMPLARALQFVELHLQDFPVKNASFLVQ